MPPDVPQRTNSRRLRSIHRKMSWEDFERLPRRVGWKHEYYGDSAHITPAKLMVVFSLPLAPRAGGDRRGVRPVAPADQKALEAPFLRAFRLAPEYADYPLGRFRKSATAYLTGFFGDVRGRWSDASFVAAVRGRIIGAALVKERQRGLLLDCVFVDPAYGRRGWATALAARAVAVLAARGEKTLRSCVHLANEPSLAWHERFGFQAIPDAWVAAHRWRICAEERERRQRLKRRSKAELARLAELEAYWEAEAERLRLLEERDFGAAHPFLD
jgi:ribosomal protein S18 acetylase RimI-like enzyme